MIRNQFVTPINSRTIIVQLSTSCFVADIVACKVKSQGGLLLTGPLLQLPAEQILAPWKLASRKEAFSSVSAWFLCILQPSCVVSSTRGYYHPVLGPANGSPSSIQFWRSLCPSWSTRPRKVSHTWYWEFNLITLGFWDQHYSPVHGLYIQRSIFNYVSLCFYVYIVCGSVQRPEEGIHSPFYKIYNLLGTFPAMS